MGLNSSQKRENTKNTQDEIQQQLEEELRRLADRVLELATKNLVQRGKANTGELMRSGRVEQTGKYTFKVIFDAPHAAPVEFGRDAGSWPPVDEIRQWVKLNLNTDEPDRVAYLVGRKIFEEGIAPVSYLRDAMRKARQEYQGG